MTKQKACKKCNKLYTGNKCPVCENNNPSDRWLGKLYIINPEKSFIAKRLKIKIKGDYAIKVK